MATRYWVGGSGTWDGSDTTHWATTNGGAGGASAPTAADDVFLGAGGGAHTISISAGAQCRNLGIGSIATDLTVNGSGGPQVYGNFDLRSSNTVSWAPNYTSFYGTGTIYCKGANIGYVEIAGASANMTLGDAFACTTFSMFNGSFNTAGFTFQCKKMLFDPAFAPTTHTFTATSGAIYVFGDSGTILDFASNTVFNAGTTLFNVSPDSGATVTVDMTGVSLYDFRFYLFNPGVTINVLGWPTSMRNFETHSSNEAVTVKVKGGTTLNVTGSFNWSGYSGRVVTLTTTTGDASLGNYSFRKSTAWQMGANSTNTTGNVGVSFTAGGGVDYFNISYMTGNVDSVKAINASTTPTKSLGKAAAKRVQANTTPTKRLARPISIRRQLTTSPVDTVIRAVSKKFAVSTPSGGGGGSVSLTAGDYAGVIQGYMQSGNVFGVPATGSISGEPVQGKTLDSLITGSFYNYVIFSGDTTSAGTCTLSVNGTSWTVGGGTYDSGTNTTTYPISGGTFTNGITYTITMTLGGIGAGSGTSMASMTKTRRYTRTIQASASAIARLVRMFNKTILDNASVVAVLLKGVPKNIAAQGSAVGSLVRAIMHVVQGSASSSTTLGRSRVTFVALQATASVVDILVKSLSWFKQASTSPLASFVRVGSMFRALQATSAPVATNGRALAKLLQSTSLTAVGLIRTLPLRVNATAGQITSVIKQFLRSIPANSISVYPAASRNNTMPKSLVSSSTPTASMVWGAVKLKAVQASAAVALVLQKATAKLLQVSQSPVDSLLRVAQQYRSFAAQTAPQSSLLKLLVRVYNLTTAPIASLVRLPNKWLQAVSASVTSWRHDIAKAWQLNQSPVDSLTRATAKAFSTATSPFAMLLRGLGRFFYAQNSAVAYESHLPAKLVQATASAVSTLMRVFSHLMQAATTPITARLLQLNHVVYAQAASTALLIRGIVKTLQGASAPSGSFNKVAAKAVGVFLGTVAVLRRSTAKSFVVGVQSFTTRINSLAKAWLLSQVPVDTLVKSTLFNRNTQTPGIPSQQHTLGRGLAALTTPTTTLVRGAAKSLVVAVSTVVAKALQHLRRVSLIQAPVATLTRTASRLAYVFTQPLPTLQKTFSRAIQLVTIPVANLVRGAVKAFQKVQAPVATRYQSAIKEMGALVETTASFLQATLFDRILGTETIPETSLTKEIGHWINVAAETVATAFKTMFENFTTSVGVVASKVVLPIKNLQAVVGGIASLVWQALIRSIPPKWSIIKTDNTDQPIKAAKRRGILRTPPRGGPIDTDGGRNR